MTKKHNISHSGSHLLPLLLTAAIIIALTGSCRRLPSQADNHLIGIDSIIENRPDSALTMLRAIDTTRLNLPESHALYALLLTQAEDKNFIDSNSDTLISRATSFYSTHPGLSPTRRLRAHFYHARILSNAKNYADASTHLLQARDIAESINDHYWLGRINAQFADIYNATFNYATAIPHLKSAISEFHKADKPEFMCDAIENLVKAYNNTDNHSEALNLINKIRNSNLMKDHTPHLLQSEAIANFYSHRFSEAKKIFLNLERTYGGISDVVIGAPEFTNIAYIYGLESKADSMLIYLKKAGKVCKNSNDSTYLAHRYFSYYTITGQTDSAMKSINKFMGLLSNSWSMAVREHPAVGTNNYLISKVATEHRQKQSVKHIAIVSWLCLTLIIILIILYHREYKKRKTSEFITLLSRYNKLADDRCRYAENRASAHIDNAEKADNPELTPLIHSLVSSRFSYLNSISKRAFLPLSVDPGSVILKQEDASVLNTIKTELLHIASAESLAELEKTLNLSHNNILIRLKTDFPGLKEIDMSIIILLFSGLSSHSICIALQFTNLAYLRTRKARIKKIISESNSQFKNEYLSHF